MRSTSMLRSVRALRSLSLTLLLVAGGLACATVHAESVDYFKAQLEPYTQKPKFIPAGPAFDATACAKGKTLFAIPQSSANPFTDTIAKAMSGASREIDLKVTGGDTTGR